MFTQTQLHFFHEKIKYIQTALLTNQSHSVLKLPNRVISISYIDDVGQLWFFVPRPTQHLTEFEREFPVKLQFSKKGTPWFFTIEGKVHMVVDPEEQNELDFLPADMKERAVKKDLLLKLEISKLKYAKLKVKPTRRVADSWTNVFHRLVQTQRLVFNQLLVKLHF
jgi:hypothetical protein